MECGEPDGGRVAHPGTLGFEPFVGAPFREAVGVSAEGVGPGPDPHRGCNPGKVTQSLRKFQLLKVG